MFYPYASSADALAALASAALISGKNLLGGKALGERLPPFQKNKKKKVKKPKKNIGKFVSMEEDFRKKRHVKRLPC